MLSTALKKVNTGFSVLGPAMRKAAEENKNFGQLLGTVEDYKPHNPCTTGTYEERRYHRLRYRRDQTARYELSNPNSAQFGRREAYFNPSKRED